MSNRDFMPGCSIPNTFLANDQTYIAQLLGRMVRAAFARRIPGNDRLNSVDCLLPKFDKDDVERVVAALKSGNGETMTPIR